MVGPMSFLEQGIVFIPLVFGALGGVLVHNDVCLLPLVTSLIKQKKRCAAHGRHRSNPTCCK